MKEDIVIDGPIDKIVYSVDLEGIKYKKVNDEWHFYDKDGKDIFYIPKPFMVDGNGRRSDDVKLWLADDKLYVVPNQDWLESSDTVYPVTIDPSLMITILTVHSHPQQGDDWIVEFETQGKADLKIIPDDQSTIDDDEFTGLYCGDEEITPEILENDVIYVENWECNQTAKVIHYTKKAGNHTLRFEFGGQTAYAYNSQSTYTFNDCGGATTKSYGGQIYDLVEIGSQCWFAENLNVSNGSTDQTCSITKYCYDDTPSNCTIYGGLYTWTDMMCGEPSSNSEPSGVQGICPNGWHVPSHYEIVTLERQACSDIGNTGCDTTFPKNTTTAGYLGQDTTTAEGEGSYLAGNEPLWFNNNLDHQGAGDNDFGVSGLNIPPAGYHSTIGDYRYLTRSTALWTSTEDSTNAWSRTLRDYHTDVYRSSGNSKAFGFSVRCVKDGPGFAYEKYGATAFTNQDDTGNSEATNTDYDNISSTNDVRWETTGATADGEYDSQLYKFYINEAEATVKQLDFKWEGYGETAATYDTTFSAWDYDISDWGQLVNVDFTSATDQTLTFPESTDPGKFVDSDGEVTLMVETRKYVNLCAGTTIDNCSCPGTDYCELNVSGDTVYVDCNADKCWSPTAGSTHEWGGFGIDEPTDSCVGIADRPACNYCETLNYGGKTDWVLPTSTVLDALCNSGSCSGTCFSGEGYSDVYWSSTENNGSSTWYVGFHNCSTVILDKRVDIYVRCIR